MGGLEVKPSGSSPYRPRLAQGLAYADAFEMKPRKRASLSGLVVVELVSGRRVIVSPDDLPRLGALPPIASVRLASFLVFPKTENQPSNAKTNTIRSEPMKPQGSGR